MNDTHGRVIGSPREFRFEGEPVRYGCNEGYALMSNPNVQTTIFCNMHGQWSNENDTNLPSCRGTFSLKIYFAVTETRLFAIRIKNLLSLQSPDCIFSPFVTIPFGYVHVINSC